MKRHMLIYLALLVLCGCGQQKSSADLVLQLKDKESAQRLHAINELKTRGHDAGVVVPALAECLKDEDAYVRRDAAEALGCFGADGKPAATALENALRDKTLRVRKAAAESLKKVDPEMAARAGVR